MLTFTQKIVVFIVLVVLTPIVAIFATTLDVSATTYQARYVRPAQVAEDHKAKGTDRIVPTTNIPLLSDDGYTTDGAQENSKQEPSLLSTLTTAASEFLPFILPGTSAPHGDTTCTLTVDGTTYSVSTDGSCSDL